MSAVPIAAVDRWPVLCVLDDNPAVLARLRAVFERARFCVHGFSEARSALQALPQLGAEALLLDFNLRDDNGIRVLCELQACGMVPGLPVLVVTGLDLRDHLRSEVFAAGAIDVVDRRTCDSELVCRVSNLVALRRAASARRPTATP